MSNCSLLCQRCNGIRQENAGFEFATGIAAIHPSKGIAEDGALFPSEGLFFKMSNLMSRNRFDPFHAKSLTAAGLTLIIDDDDLCVQRLTSQEDANVKRCSTTLGASFCSQCPTFHRIYNYQMPCFT
jgi:hypothetical protein